MSAFTVRVNIRLVIDGHTVVYEHDGKPFTMQDLAALLSGGSSKEFESSETTGRFGTGFLVTHVLSLQIGFQGVLAADHGHEEVSLKLDRSGMDSISSLSPIAPPSASSGEPTSGNGRSISCRATASPKR